MNLTGEQAIELIPHLVAIFEKIDLANHIAKSKITAVKDETELEAKGIELAIYVVKRLPEVKHEVFSAAGILSGKSAEEIAKEPISTTINALRVIFQDKETMGFFTSAMQSATQKR